MNLFGVGPTEIFVVLIVILVLFGPDKLPELAKKIGGASREIRDNLNAVNEQMNSALETSMETDKARMTPPAVVSTSSSAVVSTPSPPDSSITPAATPALPETTENRILPADSPTDLPPSAPENHVG